MHATDFGNADNLKTFCPMNPYGMRKSKTTKERGREGERESERARPRIFHFHFGISIGNFAISIKKYFRRKVWVKLFRQFTAQLSLASIFELPFLGQETEKKKEKRYRNSDNYVGPLIERFHVPIQYEFMYMLI